MPAATVTVQQQKVICPACGAYVGYTVPSAKGYAYLRCPRKNCGKYFRFKVVEGEVESKTVQVGA